jgi:hypothetical protein
LRVETGAEVVGAGETDPKRMTRAGTLGDMFEVYFRTANGNLYIVWPQLKPQENWRLAMQAAESFSLSFYGRAELPWRFAENRPVALVFFIRPKALPSVLEIRDAEIVRWGVQRPQDLRLQAARQARQ